MCPKYPTDVSRKPRFEKIWPACRGSNVARANGYGPSCTAIDRYRAADRRQRRRDKDHRPPVNAAESVDEMRQRRTDGQCTHHDPECHPTARPVPRRNDLQRHGIHAGQERAGQKSQRQRNLDAAGRGDASVRGRGAERRIQNTRRGGNTSARLSNADVSAPKTNPSCTAIVSRDACSCRGATRSRTCGITADAENHVVMQSTTTIAIVCECSPSPVDSVAPGLALSQRNVRSALVMSSDYTAPYGASVSICPNVNAPLGTNSGLYRADGRAYDRFPLPTQGSEGVSIMTTAAPAKQQQKAVYQLQGTLLEVCSCGVLCPCWVGEDPDGGECFSFLSHSFKQGQIDGIDVVRPEHRQRRPHPGERADAEVVEDGALRVGQGIGRSRRTRSSARTRASSAVRSRTSPGSSARSSRSRARRSSTTSSTARARSASRASWRRRWRRIGAATARSRRCGTASSARCRDRRRGSARRRTRRSTCRSSGSSGTAATATTRSSPSTRWSTTA